MDTWLGLRARLGKVGRIIDQGDDHLTVDISLLLGSVSRAQRVDLALIRRHGAAWIIVTAPIAALARFDAARVLEHNATLVVGSLCALQQTLVARLTLACDRLDAEQAISEIAFLCMDALRLAEDGLRSSSMFEHYVR